MSSTPINIDDSELQQNAPMKASESTSFRPTGPIIETPLPMRRIDEDVRDCSPISPILPTQHHDDEPAERENSETDEERLRREEEESEALARALMAEEAMAVSYHMSVDYLRNNRDQFSEEDLVALQAAMEEDEIQEEIEDAEDDGGMSYEMMLRLGEHLGDVKSERWTRVAREKIDEHPTFAFDPAAVKGMDENDCNVKCLVCQFAYEEGDCLRRLTRCGHCFHRDCVDQWLLSKDCCPYCRKTIVEEEEQS